MATETKNESPKLLFLLMLSALFQPVIAFSPHRHPVGFGDKFITMGYLIGVWIWFWRSLAQRFGWPPFARWLIPSALFVLPLVALHTVDNSLGSVPGNYASAILILCVIGYNMRKAKVEIAPPSADTPPSAKIEAS